MKFAYKQIEKFLRGQILDLRKRQFKRKIYARAFKNLFPLFYRKKPFFVLAAHDRHNPDRQTKVFRPFHELFMPCVQAVETAEQHHAPAVFIKLSAKIDRF